MKLNVKEWLIVELACVCQNGVGSHLVGQPPFDPTRLTTAERPGGSVHGWPLRIPVHDPGRQGMCSLRNNARQYVCKQATGLDA